MFNVFAMLVPDLLHEFELGMWKAVLAHLLRILIAAGDSAINKLDARYVPRNTSHVRSYDDLLQLCHHANVWAKHHPTVWQKCLRDEETGSPNMPRRTDRKRRHLVSSSEENEDSEDAQSIPAVRPKKKKVKTQVCAYLFSFPS